MESSFLQDAGQRMRYSIKICPDFDVYLWDEENVPLELSDLTDINGNPIQMPEFDDWAKEITPIVIDSETGHPYKKDWEDFHKRGLAYAHKLRKMLTSSCELWYEAPWEDKSGIISRPIQIVNNLQPNIHPKTTMNDKIALLSAQPNTIRDLVISDGKAIIEVDVTENDLTHTCSVGDRLLVEPGKPPISASKRYIVWYQDKLIYCKIKLRRKGTVWNILGIGDVDTKDIKFWCNAKKK